MTTIYKTSYGSIWKTYSKIHAISQLTEQQFLDYYKNEYELQVEPSSYTVDFTVTPTLFKYKITDSYGSILEQARITLDSVKQHYNFYAQSFFTAIYAEDSTEHEYQTKELVNLLADSYITKRPTLKPPVTNTPGIVYVPFEIFFPTAASTFESCKVRLQGCDVNNITVKLNGSIIEPAIADNWKSLFTPITLTTTSTNFTVGDIIPVTVTSADANLEYVILEQGVGVLDRTQVNLTNGIGKFNILTETLESGDTVTVYAGFKKYTKAAEFNITLN